MNRRINVLRFSVLDSLMPQLHVVVYPYFIYPLLHFLLDGQLVNEYREITKSIELSEIGYEGRRATRRFFFGYEDVS